MTLPSVNSATSSHNSGSRLALSPVTVFLHLSRTSKLMLYCYASREEVTRTQEDQNYHPWQTGRSLVTCRMCDSSAGVLVGTDCFHLRGASQGLNSALGLAGLANLSNLSCLPSLPSLSFPTSSGMGQQSDDVVTLHRELDGQQAVALVYTLAQLAEESSQMATSASAYCANSVSDDPIEATALAEAAQQVAGGNSETCGLAASSSVVKAVTPSPHVPSLFVPSGCDASILGSCHVGIVLSQDGQQGQRGRLGHEPEADRNAGCRGRRARGPDLQTTCLAARSNGASNDREEVQGALQVEYDGAVSKGIVL